MATDEGSLPDLRSVGIFLGPYRNLTTLTASVLGLHPHCQVLNHAGVRILGNPLLDFFVASDTAVFREFCRFAVTASASGLPGRHGGSIRHSHAFGARHEVSRLYADRFGETDLKSRIVTLVWKESLDVSRHIRQHAVDVAALLKKHAELRFLMPVRHPIDCAYSNIASKHARSLVRERPISFEKVLAAVIDELCWFAALRESAPDRMLLFFEYEIGRPLIRQLQTFLELEADEEWTEAASRALVSKKHYDRNPAAIEAFRRILAEKCAAHPDLHSALAEFVA